MKEEILIDINVQEDTGDFAKLTQLKNTIIGLKTEQQNLQKAFKDGKITQKEFAQEAVRMEAVQKKLNAEYGETQRKVTGLKSPFESLNASIKEHAQSVSIAGVSLSSFVNPATATIAVLGGLFKAYSSSTIGAKDLEFAHRQLGIVTTILADDFAKLISSGEDGEGFFTKILNSLPAISATAQGIFDPGGAAIAKKRMEDTFERAKDIAMTYERLEDLAIEESYARQSINDALENNQEILTKISDSQVSYNDKLPLFKQAIDNILDSEKELLRVKHDQLIELKAQELPNAENKELHQKEADLENEIARLQKDSAKKIEAINRAQSNLTDTERKRVEQEQKAQQAKAKADYQAEISLRNQITLQKRLVEIAQQNFATATKEQMGAVKKGLNEGLKTTMGNLANSQVTDDKNLKSGKEMRVENAKQEATEIAQIQQSIFQQSSQAMQQYLSDSQDKAMGLLKGFIASTIRAFKVQIEFMILGQELASKGIFGAVTAALEIGVVELAFAAAEQALTSFAGGGYTGPGGKYQPAGVVHKGEVVWSQADVSAMGGPEVVDRMRPTYKQYWDGGVVGGIMQNERNQVAMNNSIRSIQPVLVIEQVEGLLNQRVVIRQRAGQ